MEVLYLFIFTDGHRSVHGIGNWRDPRKNGMWNTFFNLVWSNLISAWALALANNTLWYWDDKFPGVGKSLEEKRCTHEINMWERWNSLWKRGLFHYWVLPPLEENVYGSYSSFFLVSSTTLRRLNGALFVNSAIYRDTF